MELVRHGDEDALTARGDVPDALVQERVLLVLVRIHRIHVPASGRLSARCMNFSQPSAARRRRARLGAPG
ncbi:hypothetical protein [Streptomyces sp. NPDC046887]|uniref:hypothetical protein n=1 Tax=Streptomyces sp. NPDC046887 TaxID=3155472 RepID=UPI003400905B